MHQDTSINDFDKIFYLHEEQYDVNLQQVILFEYFKEVLIKVVEVLMMNHHLQFLVRYNYQIHHIDHLNPCFYYKINL